MTRPRLQKLLAFSVKQKKEKKMQASLHPKLLVLTSFTQNVSFGVQLGNHAVITIIKKNPKGVDVSSCIGCN